ncbi:hypothetical protein DY000_02039626 [Brassica cretica]|uniref:Uncharacterized protein n=1 Tax=Brassica cretica TaxID=69181 RepID=A0ABQ7BIH8_BRACR|nr:hypothetical protein DY000_02039626 [Brassica cretica]
MTGTRLLDELAKAVRSLVLLFQSNYVRLDPRNGGFLTFLRLRKSTLEYMIEEDEQQGYGEPRRVEEAGIDVPTSTSIDTNICCRLTPPKILERSSCPQVIPDSTHKSTYVPRTWIL